MNSFVEENTAGKIKDLITADSVKDAFAFLVNAVYFKADWQGQCEKEMTADRDFYVTKGESRKVNRSAIGKLVVVSDSILE